MKKIVLLLVCTISLSACKQQSRQNAVVAQCCDTSIVECIDTTTKKTLNDIRFAGWEYEDWLDNDYIRELRLYINDYLSGEIEDAELDEYREDIKGKFAIVNIVPFVMGGAQIYICFLDCPSKVFSSWVYSSVDEENEVVLEYICKGLTYVGEEPGYTKEEIRRIMSEHPEIKAW
jgi:hypothetical protein